MPQQNEAVERVLAEIVCGIDQYAITPDPGCYRSFGSRGDFGDDVVDDAPNRRAEGDAKGTRARPVLI